MKTFGIQALVATLACGLAATASAQEGPGYRLKLDDPGAYRLQLANPRTYRLDKGEERSEVAAVEDMRLPSSLASLPYAKLIEAAAREAALDPALVHALIFVESGYNPNARSAKGAIGLMQVLPETAARYGINNIAQSSVANLRAGTRYLSDLLRMFDCRLDLALAAYNAGEKTVVRYGMKIPPYAETKAYVPAVIAKFEEWRGRGAVTTTGRVRAQYSARTRIANARPQAALAAPRMLACIPEKS